MFEYEVSQGSSLYVGVYSGDVSDADYERCVSSMYAFEREQRSHPRGIAAILVNDAGVPPVPASWRKRMADFNDSVQATPYLLSIVTPSTVIRGILTAINWLSPSRKDHERVAHETFTQASAWIEKRRGVAQPELAPLYAAARAKLPARKAG
jgi:hypothetical protein